MKKPIFALILFAFLLAISPTYATDDVTVDLDNVTLPIEENQGQTDPQVEYMAQTLYGTAYITNNSITNSINTANGTIVIREEFLDKGSTISFQPQGTDPSTAKVSYYQGNNPDEWIGNVNTYQTVTLGEIYPGVEVLIRSYASNLEKIYIISPGASPSIIRVLLKGADHLEIAPNGELLLHTQLGSLALTAPVAYQETATGRNMVNVNYQLLSSDVYGFQLGEYDPNLPLYIDPKLVYSTFIGGSSTEYGLKMLMDDLGRVYIAGYTSSSNYPTTTGAYQPTYTGATDVFLSIINPLANGASDLVYSTYLGGAGYDYGYSLALDNLGRVYLTGGTGSANFPTTTGSYQTTLSGSYDAFLSIINPLGNGVNDLVYSTYLGGTGNDRAHDLVVDDLGRAYLSGNTASSNLPTTLGAFQTSLSGSSDAFLSIINPLGTGASDLVYSTYLGGSNREAMGTAITLDNTGLVYLMGYTDSGNFPVTPGSFQTSLAGSYDLFMSIINPLGTGVSDLVYSTYLGGSMADYLVLLISDHSNCQILTDSLGRAYLMGTTYSTNFPVTSNAYQPTSNGNYDAFFAIINPLSTGTSDLVYSTYLGGISTDLGGGLALGSNGMIYLTGGSASNNFPVTGDAYQPANAGNYDAFLTVLNPNQSGASSLIYSTYLGGSSTDMGFAINHASDNSVYLAGTAISPNFPITSGAYQPINAGSYDVFLSKFGQAATLLVMGNLTGNKGDTVNLVATLTQTNGTVLANQTISFLVNGQNVGSAVTNENGVATLAYTITLARGTYPLSAQFAGDPNYLLATASGTLEVTGPADEPVNPPSSTEVYGKTVAMQSTGIPLAGIVLAILMFMGGLYQAHKK